MTAAHGALLGLVRSTGEERIGFLMTRGDSFFLRAALLALQYLFLFGVVVIMIAGAAESLAGLTGLPTVLLGVAVTLVIFVLALCGLNLQSERRVAAQSVDIFDDRDGCGCLATDALYAGHDPCRSAIHQS